MSSSPSIEEDASVDVMVSPVSQQGRDSAFPQPLELARAKPQSSPPAEFADREALVQELEALKEKFSSWKTRAKAGVDQQRAQIADLQAKLTEARNTSEASSSGAVQAITEVACGSTRQAMEQMILKSRGSMFTQGELAVKFKLEADTAKAELAKIKRRSEQAMRVGGQDLSTAREQIAALESSLKESKDEAASLRGAVADRQRGLDALGSQLEEAMATVERYHSNGGAEQPEVDLAALQAEFQDMWAQREIEMLDAHRAEVQQMQLSHDDEVAHLTAQLNEMPLHGGGGFAVGPVSPTASGMDPVVNDQDPHGLPASPQRREVVSQRGASSEPAGGDDEAYEMLMTEAEGLRKNLEEQAAELKVAKEELVSTKTALEKAQRNQTASAGSNASGLTSEQLQQRLGAQADTIWRLQQELLDVKAAATENRQQSSTNMTGSQPQTNGPQSNGSAQQQQQQQAYLRSVFVQFVVTKETKIAARLMPVIASLLQLTDDELRAVYGAHPNWA